MASYLMTRVPLRCATRMATKARVLPSAFSATVARAVSLETNMPLHSRMATSHAFAPHTSSSAFSSSSTATPMDPSAPMPSESKIKRERPPAINVTEAAAKRLKELLTNKPEAIGVRIGVRSRGCNGLSYTMNYATENPGKKDEVVVQHGVTVFIDSKALFYIIGTTMDHVDTEMASEFVFINPKSKGTCGCGESFNI